MLNSDDLIGAPFEWGGRGPDKYDCYGLLMEMWKRKYGVNIPDFQSPTGDSDISTKMAETMAQVYSGMSDWVEVAPSPYVAVLFRVKRYAAHIGFTLPYGRFIHTWDRSGGVVIEKINTWKDRTVGHYVYSGS